MKSVGGGVAAAGMDLVRNLKLLQDASELLWRLAAALLGGLGAAARELHEKVFHMSPHPPQSLLFLKGSVMICDLTWFCTQGCTVVLVVRDATGLARDRQFW